MDMKKLSKLGVIALVVLGLVFLAGCASEPEGVSLSEAAALEKAASAEGYVSGLEAGAALAPAPVVQDSAETLKALEDAEAEADASSKELADLKKSLGNHEDELEQWDREDEVLGLCKAYTDEDDDEDVSDAVWEALEDAGYDVEDKDEDLLSYRWDRNEDLDVEAEDWDSEDDEKAEGEVSGEFKVKFREDGPDGDRHTAYFDALCVVEDGEVEEFSLAEQE